MKGTYQFRFKVCIGFKREISKHILDEIFTDLTWDKCVHRTISWSWNEFFYVFVQFIVVTLMCRIIKVKYWTQKSWSLLSCNRSRNKHCNSIPVMKTGFSLCSFSHSEKRVFITWEPCTGPVLALYGIAV